MRILFVTQFYDPEPTFKGHLFARELCRRGHTVTVLTGFPNYPGGRVYPGFRIRPLQREKQGDINIVRVALYPSHSRSALGRIANYLSFALTSSVAALFLRRHDVVYAYHPPGTAALAPLVLSWIKATPFVVDIQDLWPDTLAATGMLNNRRILQLIGRGMNKIYHSAAHVVVLSPGFRLMLCERGVPSEKITVIPNWTYAVDKEPNQVVAEEVKTSNRHLARNRPGFDVVFAGNMGAAQGLDTVIKAARILEKMEPAVQFVMVGDGVEREHLQADVTALNLRNVKFLPRREPHEMAPVFAEADCLLVHLKADPLFAVTIPSKTQAYLQTGKPLIMAVSGDAAEMVGKAGAGLIVPPEDPERLARAVLELHAMSVKDRRAMGRRGAEFYQAELALPIGASRFEKVFDQARFASRPGAGLKRLGDIFVSASLLAAFSIPLILLSLLVALKLGRPVVFRQKRPGRFGKTFEILKLRTMTNDRGKDGQLLRDSERLTPFGSWLRSTSLDELPALWNVLRGDMSLVGPRPLLERYTRYFSEEELLRLVVRPGVTGYAQVNGRNNAPWDERLAMDVHYVRTWSLKLDIIVLCRTALRVIQRADIVIDPESTMMNLDDERSDWPERS